MHAVLYWHTYNSPPPKPFAIAILGHAHEIKIPDLDMFPGFEDVYYRGAGKGERTVMRERADRVESPVLSERTESLESTALRE
jgi:hypothetical protein